jgi:ABC-2 type transport system ATP-binding protein
MKRVLEVKNLVKRFHHFTAVNDISFHMQEGEVLGLLGPNGAGKTTTIQMLLSIMSPTSGSIFYFGKSLQTHRSEVLQKVSFASTYVRLPGRLSIAQNLDIYGRLYGLTAQTRKDRIEKLLNFFHIWDIRNRSSGVLSAGQITRVMLAKAFLTYPAIVLLDEPTASLDPDIALDVRKFIREEQKEYGVSILLTSHNMDEVTEVCDRVMVLQHGVIIADNTPQELAQSVTHARINLLLTRNKEVAEQYLHDNDLTFQHSGAFTEIQVEERFIAQLLTDFSKKDIYYDQISIDKPTLEDYFLHITRSGRQKKASKNIE